MSNKELDRFALEIDLREFAASYLGYQHLEKESYSRTTVMRHADGTKIHISQNDAGGWVYYNFKNNRDTGNIIHLLQRHTGQTLGRVRQTLRAWQGAERPASRKKAFSPLLPKVEVNREAVLQAYEQAAYAVHVPYLASRGLIGDILGQDRFRGRFKVGSGFSPEKEQERKQARRFIPYDNVLFPHHDKGGLCGFEVKNKGFTGFASGGVKGLWFSLIKATDTALVFTEAAIDGISYHVLNPAPATRYMSTGGAMNPQQPELIRAAMGKMPKGAAIVLAFDNDEGGEKLAEEVRGLAPAHVEISRPLPPVGTDWNETLKSKLGL